MTFAVGVEEPWIYEPEDLVWHYTNGAALINILKNHELWASSTAFMNDTGEWRLADKYLRAAQKRDPETFPRSLNSYLEHVGGWENTDADESRYLLSASRSGDSLTMWRGYAGTDEVSYAIGLDRRAGLSILQPPGVWSHLSSNNRVSPWIDVSYDPRVAIDRAKQAVKAIFDEYQAMSLITSEAEQNERIGQMFITIGDLTERLRNETKHEGFKHEEESRVVVKADQHLARYRPGRWGMVPYLSLTGAAGRAQQVVSDPARLPIREIYISPGSGRYNAARSLQHMLDSCGYGGAYYEPRHQLVNEVRIRVSTTPFR